MAPVGFASEFTPPTRITSGRLFNKGGLFLIHPFEPALARPYSTVREVDKLRITFPDPLERLEVLNRLVPSVQTVEHGSQAEVGTGEVRIDLDCPEVPDLGVFQAPTRLEC